MRIDEFSWRDEKAAENLAKHGVSFDRAMQAVRDHFAIETIDDRDNYHEERVNLIGNSEGALLHVTYTERDERIHIISARRAEKHEQDNYYRENAGGRHGH
jgi:uncharacterized DUF497 family protein